MIKRARFFAAVGLALAVPMTSLRAEISDGVVKIGVLTDMSGLYADVAGRGSVEAAKMASEVFGGKVAGMPIQIVFGDHQNKPDVASAIARQWFDQDHVDVIVDLPNSAVALAVADVGKSRSKAVLVSSGGTSDLTGKQCAPTTIHWSYDTWALANSTANALVKSGGDSWFFLTADYAFGQALERDTSEFVRKAHGQVIGSIRAPLNTVDFSSYLMQAQSSGAKVVGLANAGQDSANAVKGAAEFGLTEKGQKLAGLLLTLADIHAIGLETAQGLFVTSAVYWDMTPATRAFAAEMAARNNGIYPDMFSAGVYSSVLHYLKAVEASKSDDGLTVIKKMKQIPIDDILFGRGMIREDGRAIHNMYLFQVKTPAESKSPWDLYALRATIPGDEAFKPMADGGCSLVHTN